MADQHKLGDIIEDLEADNIENEAPNIDHINQEIVNKRLLKCTQAHDILSSTFSEMVLTCKTLTEQNSECNKKYEQLETKYIKKKDKLSMALSVIEEKDKYIQKLEEKLRERDDEVLPVKDDLPELSPECTQYPECSEEPGGDSSILNAQRLSYALCKKLKEISEDDNLITKSPVFKTQTDNASEKKSYELDNTNPYLQNTSSARILTADNNLQDTIDKIENDLKRKRRASEMEEFVDFDDNNQAIKQPVLNSRESKKTSNFVDSSRSSLAKINMKKKMSKTNTYKAKRVKKNDKEDSSSLVSIKKTHKVSRTTGWIIEKKDKSNGKKNKKTYDVFHNFDSENDDKNVKSPEKPPEKSPPKKPAAKKKNAKKKMKSNNKKKAKRPKKTQKEPDQSEAEEDYEIIVSADSESALCEAKMRESRRKSTSDYDNESSVPLTDGKSPIKHQDFSVQEISSKEVTELKEVENIEDSDEEQKHNEARPFKHKFREACRDREERRKRKGQACEKCNQWYNLVGEDVEQMLHECSRHRDNNKIMNTPPRFYETDI
ncbi:unnamed protein product [Moneuplotes crassus]|uniref:DNA endonuclease RBBP8 n=1 Tax=Euplotes crassus TaxID=5936 RepID=A0AAD1XAG3_EUPCR|nr:unnamed protein product [Moneuplotes crassus]